MDKILVMMANWKTTVLGFLGGVALYVVLNGVKMPTNAQEWWSFVAAAVVAGLGLVSKDANTGSKPLVVLLALGLAFGGCATVKADLDKILGDLSTFSTADLDRAIAMANKAPDAEATFRARCYTTLKKYVPSGSTVGEALLPIGAVSAFEKFAEADQRARAGIGIPQEIRADCAVILLSAGEFAARMGLKFAPIPGAGAVGGLLK